MPLEPDSDTITAESVAIQVIRDNQELAKQYAAGDLTVMSVLQDQAIQLAAGRIDEQSVKDVLLRKLGASY